MAAMTGLEWPGGMSAVTRQPAAFAVKKHTPVVGRNLGRARYPKRPDV